MFVTRSLHLDLNFGKILVLQKLSPLARAFSRSPVNL